jgi:hypothetical protein
MPFPNRDVLDLQSHECDLSRFVKRVTTRNTSPSPAIESAAYRFDMAERHGGTVNYPEFVRRL